MEKVDLGVVHYSYWKNRKVFVTGHTGFKGTWMLFLLKKFGAIVKGYSLDPLNSFDIYNTAAGGNLCESIIADVRDKHKLEAEILKFEPDVIFHMAAQPLVRRSYEIPSETFLINAIGTSNLLESLIKLKKKCNVILITTDKVYENFEWVFPYRETDRLGGRDPYSASKACAEIIIESFKNSFFNSKKYRNHKKSIASVRSGNVIGGGDWSIDRIIPDIINSIKTNKKIILRNPKSTRPWQHVLDPLFGYLTLSVKMDEAPTQYNQAWNFGPMNDTPISVEELTQISIKTFGKGDYECPQFLNELHEANLLNLDISKAINYLNWKPAYSSVEAIEKTILWYKKQILENFEPDVLIKNDIDFFLKVLNEKNSNYRS